MSTKHNITPLYRYLRDLAQELYPVYHAPIPMLGFVRDNELISVVVVPGGAPEDITAAALIGTIGYKPRGIVMLNEAYETSHVCNPVTGEPWKGGEIESTFVNDGGLGGVVTETMICTYVSNGKAELARQQFSRKEDAVAWGEEEVVSERDNATIYGAMLALLRDVLSNPKNLPGANVVEDGLARAMEAYRDLAEDYAVENKMDFITSAMMSAAGLVPLWNEALTHDVNLVSS